LSNINIYFR